MGNQEEVVALIADILAELKTLNAGLEQQRTDAQKASNEAMTYQNQLMGLMAPVMSRMPPHMQAILAKHPTGKVPLSPNIKPRPVTAEELEAGRPLKTGQPGGTGCRGCKATEAEIFQDDPPVP